MGLKLLTFRERLNSMSTVQLNLVVHVLAMLNGIIVIVAASAVALGIPVYVAGILAVVSTILLYIINQIPTLGTAPTPPQPTPLADIPVVPPAVV